MALADWDRSGGLAFVTFDDTATENIFGQCLQVTAPGFAFVDTAFSQADMHAECEFYHATQTNNSEFMVGVRINKATGDGYYAGMNFFNLPSAGVSDMSIYKRVGGVFTNLAFRDLPDTAKPTDQLSKIIFRIEGSQLAVYYTIGGSLFASSSVVDTSIVGAGTAGVLSEQPSGQLRIKNFLAADV